VPRKTLLIGISAILAIFALSVIILFKGNNKPAFRGVAINPPVRAADIKLTDQDGNAFQLSNARGKVVVLVFGFTNCVAECPLTMAHIKLALEKLGSSAQNVEVVMVSTDPLRDTPQAMKDFLRSFNPFFIGLPGTSDELSKVWNDYGIVVLEGGESHSSTSYVIDQKGEMRLTFTPETSPDDIAADLNVLLTE